MRVVIVAGPYYPVPPLAYGGTERVIYYLERGLREAGHETILLATADSEVDCKLIPIARKSLGLPKIIYPGYARSVKRIEKATAAKLRNLLPEIDIIHSHGFDLKEFSSFPNVTTIHNKVTFENLSYYKKRQNLNYVSISKDQQNLLPTLNFIDAIYNGLDTVDFPIIQKPKNYLCFLGRLDDDKNPHLAIELAINLKMPIKLAGKLDQNGLHYFRTKIKPLLSHPLVEYLGEIDSAERIKLLSNAACNLHPVGFREPFGLTIIEAGYCGTPTLAIKRGSMPELIKDGVNGLLVGDFIEGYNKIGDCLDLDRKTVANFTRKKFNHRKMANNYITAYQQVLAKHSK